MQEENSTSETVASTLAHPNERGSTVEPIRQCVALLWPCKFCGHHHITKHITATVVANFERGSSREPLRAVCPNCGKRQRLRSENHNLVWAEVPWRRINQRNALARVAENLNIIASDGTTPRRKDAMDEWNREVGYKGKKAKPQPFKRWDKRGGVW